MSSDVQCIAPYNKYSDLYTSAFILELIATQTENNMVIQMILVWYQMELLNIISLEFN